MNWTPVARPTEEEAEIAGYDAGTNGSNTTNTHFRFFGSRELTDAWERGKRRAAQPRQWLRYGQWAAHLYENGRQLCSTPHGQFPPELLKEGAKPMPVAVTRHGQPFGRVCARCLKLSRSEPASAEPRR